MTNDEHRRLSGTRAHAGRRVLLLALLSAVCVARGLGQQAEPNAPAQAPPPPAGFWPTPKMIEGICENIALDMVDEYGLDDTQRAQIEALLKERFPAWLEQVRPQLQPVINRFFEIQLSTHAPDPNEIQSFARQALPVLDSFKEFVVDLTQDVQPWLTEEQQIKLEGNVAAFEAAVTMIGARLADWAAGGYDPQTDFFMNPAARRRRVEQQRREARELAEQARRDAEARARGGQPASQPVATSTAPAESKDEWEIYVEQFIAKYELDAQQRQKAYAFLHAQQDAREKYLASKRGAMQRLARRLAAAKTDAERTEILGQLEKIHAPVKRMFERLKAKLMTLPTRAQLRRAQKEK